MKLLPPVRLDFVHFHPQDVQTIMVKIESQAVCIYRHSDGTYRGYVVTPSGGRHTPPREYIADAFSDCVRVQIEETL